MVPLTIHAHEEVDGGISVELAQRGDTWYLNADRVLVRSSDVTRIDEVAVVEACQPLAAKRQPRVLIEGLGLGAAARKALKVLPPRGRLVVAEAVPAIMAWNRQFLEPIPRPKFPEHFRVVPESLRACLEKHPAYFDAILLELDYALDPLLESGQRPSVYRAPIVQLKQALRPRGQLVIRSLDADPAMAKALRLEGFTVEGRAEAPHKRSRARRHYLTCAQLPAGSSSE